MRHILLIVALLTTTLAAQQAPAPPDTPFTLRTTTNLVFVPTQVLTKKGDLLYTLRPDQFLLTDNNIPQTIRVDDDPDALGLSLAVVVQCSRTAFRDFTSMRGLPAMVASLTGDATPIPGTSPNQVALISYGSEIELLTPLTASPQKLAAAYNNLEPCEDEKDARTLDAVDYARNLLESIPASAHTRRAILLIGETRDHGSHIKPAQAVAALGRSNTVVDAVSFTPGAQDLFALLRGAAPNPAEAILLVVNALRRNIPHTLANLTGGEFSTFNSQKGFEQRVSRLANRIHNYYLLSFQPSDPSGTPIAPGLHHIAVSVPDHIDAKIRHRLTYYYGETPPPRPPRPRPRYPAKVKGSGISGAPRLAIQRQASFQAEPRTTVFTVRRAQREVSQPIELQRRNRNFLPHLHLVRIRQPTRLRDRQVVVRIAVKQLAHLAQIIPGHQRVLLAVPARIRNLMLQVRILRVHSLDRIPNPVQYHLARYLRHQVVLLTHQFRSHKLRPVRLKLFHRIDYRLVLLLQLREISH